MGHLQTREKKHLQTRGKNTSKQGGEKHLQAREKHLQTRKIPFEQEKYLSSKGNAFQARGIFRSNVKVYKW
nr:MAG TPA: hypothetical protein [Caudoviricetes sp.]